MLSQKFVRKYMRMAKHVGEDQNPCYSRRIGTVLVDPIRNKVLGTGYNGPVRGTPHTTTRTYLENIVWPQLTEEERKIALAQIDRASIPPDCQLEKDLFLHAYSDCKTCPRRLIGAKSGQRPELCSCAHSEANAIHNAACDLHGAWLFGWCGVACWDCTKAIIQVGISKCYFMDWGADYSPGSRWLFTQAGIDVVVEDPEYYLGDD